MPENDFFIGFLFSVAFYFWEEEDSGLVFLKNFTDRRCRVGGYIEWNKSKYIIFSCRSTGGASTSNEPLLQQLSLPAPPSSNGTATPAAPVDPHMDLLSGDSYNTPAAENPLALVPVSTTPASSISDQNVLALSDMFAASTNSSSNQNGSLGSQSLQPVQQTYATAPQFQPQQQLALVPSPSPPQQPPYYSNGELPNMNFPQYEQQPHIPGAQLNNLNASWNVPSAQNYNPTNQQELVYGNISLTVLLC